jgi:hypothetical protein
MEGRPSQQDAVPAPHPTVAIDAGKADTGATKTAPGRVDSGVWRFGDRGTFYGKDKAWSSGRLTNLPRFFKAFSSPGNFAICRFLG